MTKSLLSDVDIYLPREAFLSYLYPAIVTMLGVIDTAFISVYC